MGKAFFYSIVEWVQTRQTLKESDENQFNCVITSVVCKISLPFFFKKNDQN